MGKEKTARIKKSLAILLLACFIISVTAAAVSAKKDNFNANWGINSQNAYNNAYNGQVSSGENKGKSDGFQQGFQDCRNGLDNTGGDSKKGHLKTTSKSPQTLGRIDGFNDGYDDGYANGYQQGYINCQNSNQQGQGFNPFNP